MLLELLIYSDMWLIYSCFVSGAHMVAQLVEALHYKPEGCVFDS
jgi:hypothetical protein